MARSRSSLHRTQTASLMAHIQNCIAALAGVDDVVTPDDFLGKERAPIPKQKDLSILKHLFVKDAK